MKFIATFLLFLCPVSATACGARVCLVDPDSLNLPQVITFDDQRSGAGPGHRIDDVLSLPGASFGERFAGQFVATEGDHDQIEGETLAPLSIVAGAPGQNLSLVRFSGNTVLIGFGVKGFPKRNAQGEGAIAVLFDEDQSALAFDLRGGEAGVAVVGFFRRNGEFLANVPVDPTGEFAVGFLRTGGSADIAGFVVTNMDPQGVAIDTIRFGKIPNLS